MLSGNPDYQSNPVRGLASFETKSETNQRLEFDIDSSTGQTLYVGGQDKCVRIYCISSGKLIGLIDCLDDAVNGVSYFYNESTGRSFLAVATGSRRFLSEADLDADDIPTITDDDQPPPGYLRLYSLSNAPRE